MKCEMVTHKKLNNNVKNVCYLQELDDVASSKDSMSNGELEWISGREIGSQDTLLHTPPAENLAGCTGTNHHWRRRRWWRRSGGGGGRGRALRGWRERYRGLCRRWRRWRWRRVREHGGNMDWDWWGIHFVCHRVLWETEENRGNIWRDFVWLLLCGMSWKLKGACGYIYRPKGKHVGSEWVTSSYVL